MSSFCAVCNRNFDSNGGLLQHLRDSLIRQQDPGTPFDVFFRSFPTFVYDPSLPTATAYANLQDPKYDGEAVPHRTMPKINARMH